MSRWAWDRGDGGLRPWSEALDGRSSLAARCSLLAKREMREKGTPRTEQKTTPALHVDCAASSSFRPGLASPAGTCSPTEDTAASPARRLHLPSSRAPSWEWHVVITTQAHVQDSCACRAMFLPAACPNANPQQRSCHSFAQYVCLLATTSEAGWAREAGARGLIFLEDSDSDSASKLDSTPPLLIA